MTTTHGKGAFNAQKKGRAITPFSNKFLLQKEIICDKAYKEYLKEKYHDALALGVLKRNLEQARVMISIPFQTPPEQKSKIMWGTIALVKRDEEEVFMFFENVIPIRDYELPTNCCFMVENHPVGRILWNQKVGFKVKLELDKNKPITLEILEIYTYSEGLKKFSAEVNSKEVEVTA